MNLRRRSYIAGWTATMIALAGCGGGDGTLPSGSPSGSAPATTTAEPAEPDRCETMPAKTFTEITGVKATQIAAIKTDIPDGPLDLPQNQPNHYVAAETSKGTAVWGMDGEAFEGKGGIVISADDAARAVSNAGDLVDASEYGMGPGDPDYGVVKRCL
jgi:hypothetical protein